MAPGEDKVDTLDPTEVAGNATGGIWDVPEDAIVTGTIHTDMDMEFETAGKLLTAHLSMKFPSSEQHTRWSGTEPPEIFYSIYTPLLFLCGVLKLMGRLSWSPRVN